MERLGLIRSAITTKYSPGCVESKTISGVELTACIYNSYMLCVCKSYIIKCSTLTYIGTYHKLKYDGY